MLNKYLFVSVKEKYLCQEGSFIIYRRDSILMNLNQ